MQAIQSLHKCQLSQLYTPVMKGINRSDINFSESSRVLERLQVYDWCLTPEQNLLSGS